jgi:uncharacterized membrane protein
MDSSPAGRAVESTARREPRPARDGWLIALWIAIGAWIVLFTTLAFRLHAAMRTHKADLGQIAQAVWNSSRGRFVEQTDNGFLATRLTDHVEPILALISPVLWVWEDTRALLLLQVVAVAVGAWFVYDLALLRMGRVLAPREWGQIWTREPLLSQARPLAFALAVAWLLSPQLQSAVLTEFHAAPLAAPLILWAIWAIEVRRWGHFGAAALLVAATKEETALLAALLGIWAIWRAWGMRREARAAAPSVESRAGAPPPVPPRFTRPVGPGLRWGAAVAILSLVWFALATFVIVPYNAIWLYGVAESGYFARYGALGDSPLDIVRSFFTQPGAVWQILTEPARRNYLLGLVALFAFLPLLAPDLLALSLPVLLANVLSAYPAQYFGEFHYSAPVVPYFAAAAAFGLGRLWGWIWRRTQRTSPAFQHLPAANASAMALATAARNPATAVRPILAVLLFLWIGGWGVASYLDAGRGPGGGRYDPTEITEHHRLLPAFVAQIPRDAAVTATAAVHPHLAMRRFIYQFPLGLETEPPARAAEWALLDVTTNTDMAAGDLRDRVMQMLAGDWRVVDADDGFLLLRRGEGASEIPASFYRFAQPDGAPQFDPSVVDWPRWRQSHLVAEWPTAIDPDLRVTTVDGKTLYTLGTSTPPAIVWRKQAQEAGALAADLPLRAVTSAIWLPRSVLVESNADSPGTVLRRQMSGEMAQADARSLEYRDYAQVVEDLTGDRLISAQASLGTLAPLSVTLWAEDRPTWPGDSIDLWLQWSGGAWPAEGGAQDPAPRIELRRNDEVLATSGGAPRLFGREQTAALAAGYANDWRSLTLPAELDPSGAWSVALVDTSGATVATLPLRVGPARPDQTCALIPASCAAQPR